MEGKKKAALSFHKQGDKIHFLNPVSTSYRLSRFFVYFLYVICMYNQIQKDQTGSTGQIRLFTSEHATLWPPADTSSLK